MRIRIGDMLVSAGLATEEQIGAALVRQRDTGRRLGEELVESGVVTEVQLTQVLSNQLSIPWVSLYHVEFSRDLLNLVPAELCDRHCVVPVYVRRVRREGDTLFVAMEDPTSEDALAALRASANLPVKAMVAPPSEIRNAIRVYYFGGSARPSRAAGPAAAQVEVDVDVEVDTAAEPARAEKMAAPPERARPAAAPEAKAAPSSAERPKKKKQPKKSGRMVTLTLLDGTTVRLPAPGADKADAAEDDDSRDALTASDLIAALVGRAQGADVRDVLPDDRWELLFATLLKILIRKGLIADWEFVEEWNRRKG